MSANFAIGHKSVNLEEIMGAHRPPKREMERYSAVYGRLIQSGVPILKALTLTANCVEHPWLVMATSMMYHRVRAGDTLAGGVLYCLAELKTAGADVAHLQDYFAEFLAEVEHGEEMGDLDTSLLKMAEKYANGRKDHAQPASEEKQQFAVAARRLLELMNDGVPILRSLMIVAQEPGCTLLESEIMRMCNFILAGSVLSVAAAHSAGQFSAPIPVALLTAGEVGGMLEHMLPFLAD